MQNDLSITRSFYKFQAKKMLGLQIVLLVIFHPMNYEFESH
jgi:hypothetical protein